MAHKIITGTCLGCGICIDKCPQEAIIALRKIRREGMILQPVRIDPKKCTDCGVCDTEEYWCPAQAIIKA